MNTIVIVGPTSSGKTAFSIDIASSFKGEIICADSRTVYKELTIGTAKPSAADRRKVTHYGLDLVAPSQRFSAMQFKEYCTQKVKEIEHLDKLPVIVGGSGLYIDSYVFDYQPPEVDVNLLSNYENLTIPELQKLIVDRQLTMPINYKNKLHLINTLLRNGRQPYRADTIRNNAVLVGINPPREVLKERIVKRVQQMMSDGVVEEAANAFKKYGYDAPGLRGGIYKQLALYHQGIIGIDEAVAQTIQSDIQLAKRQMTWFKRNKGIQWFTRPSDARSWIDKYLQGTL